jgi:M6 family metalloprotease-like protein
MKQTLFALGAAVSLVACDPDAAFNDNPHPEVLAFLTWKSTTTQDAYVTHDAPPDGLGYSITRQEGWVFSPDEPPPFVDAVALNGFWSAAHSDYHVTSIPGWTPIDPSYGPLRLEGYAYAQPVANSVPLHTWYSASRVDHVQTSLHDWIPAAGTRAPDYIHQRLEGYLPPPDEMSWGQKAIDLGYREIDPSATLAIGTRPLLLVRTAVVGNPPLAHDLAFYDNLVFGTARPNIRAYFSEISNGLFTWTRAGAFDMPFPLASSSTLETRTRFAIQLIAANGFNFQPFDTDGDGVLYSHELAVVMFDNVTSAGGAARFPACVTIPNQGLSYCGYSGTTSGVFVPGAAGLGHQTAFINIAHELAHLLGPLDAYGPACNSQNATLMSCTGYVGPDDRQLFDLDPFYKMRLGWVAPRIRSIRSPGGVERVDVPQLARATSTDHEWNDESPLVFHDPLRTTREYIFVEYRDRGVDAGVAYDDHGPARGIYVWNVQVDANNYPVQVPRISAAGTEPALFTQAPPTGIRGLTAPWTSAHGEFIVRWLNGTDSGLRIRVLDPDSSGRTVIEWRHANAPLIPRIDQLSATSGSPGAQIAIDGAFGVIPGDRRFFFEHAGSRVALTVLTWSPFRVDVSVPAGTLPGAGRIYADTGAATAIQGNAVAFTVL